MKTNEEIIEDIFDLLEGKHHMRESTFLKVFEFKHGFSLRYDLLKYSIECSAGWKIQQHPRGFNMIVRRGIPLTDEVDLSDDQL